MDSPVQGIRATNVCGHSDIAYSVDAYIYLSLLEPNPILADLHHWKSTGIITYFDVTIMKGTNHAV